jgi:hypothetical protein
MLGLCTSQPNVNVCPLANACRANGKVMIISMCANNNWNHDLYIIYVEASRHTNACQHCCACSPHADRVAIVSRPCKSQDGRGTRNKKIKEEPCHGTQVQESVQGPWPVYFMRDHDVSSPWQTGAGLARGGVSRYGEMDSPVGSCTLNVVTPTTHRRVHHDAPPSCFDVGPRTGTGA